MTPQELKNSILQLAIQGKLVEQRLEEGTAEDLYREIQAQKAALIKAGKIKKEKPLPEITEDEKPFDIPESWKWVRLGGCTTYAQPKEKVAAEAILPSMWSLDLEDIEKETGRIAVHRFARERTIIGEKVCFHKGQILYSKLRPYLKKILVAPEDGICTPELVPFSVYGDINTQYLVYVLRAPHIDYIINSVTYGVKMPRVGTDTMVNLLVPLPPLAEQKRIVAKIEELLPLIDRYEQAWTKLETFNKRFPADMQKSLLQLAIQGKLVDQRPEEGTGEDLYRQIQAEKQSLIRSGKLKKDKPLPEITEDEIPFDIPDSWKWLRLGQVLSISSGDGLTTNQMAEHGLYPVYGGNGITGYHNQCNISKETLVIGRVGYYCGSTHITEKNAWVTDNAFITTFDEERISMKWLKHYIDFLEPRKKASSTAQPVISGKLLYPMLFPLPPLGEQKRIVAKLEELLPICERLK